MSEAYCEITYFEASSQAISEEMSRDEKVILIGQDLGQPKPEEGATPNTKNRFRSTPISENSSAGIGIGAAITGFRPIVNLGLASFMYLASDQIINQASKLRFMTGGQVKVPIVFLAAMYHNTSAGPQHSDRSYPLFMNTPGLKIIAPSTPADLKGLLKSAIRDDDPVLVYTELMLFDKKGSVLIDSNHTIPIGKSEIKKVGNDVTVVSIAGCLHMVLAAANTLEQEGISVEVIDPRTLIPLDKETILQSVVKTGRLIVVDYAHSTNSAASNITVAVAEGAFTSLKKPIERITTPNVHIPFSPSLEKLLYPTKERVMEVARNLMGNAN